MPIRKPYPDGRRIIKWKIRSRKMLQYGRRECKKGCKELCSKAKYPYNMIMPGASR